MSTASVQRSRRKRGTRDTRTSSRSGLRLNCWQPDVHPKPEIHEALVIQNKSQKQKLIDIVHKPEIVQSTSLSQELNARFPQQRDYIQLVLDSVQLQKRTGRPVQSMSQTQHHPDYIQRVSDSVQLQPNGEPWVVQTPATVQMINKWRINTRSQLKRTVTAQHLLSVSEEVLQKVSEVENFHSEQFEWVKKFKPVNVFSSCTVKRLKRLQTKSEHRPCEHRNCAFIAKSNKGLAAHVRRSHRSYDCTQCLYRSFDHRNLRIHVINKHVRVKKMKMVVQPKTMLMCGKCSFVNFHQNKLDKHLLSHLKKCGVLQKKNTWGKGKQDKGEKQDTNHGKRDKGVKRRDERHLKTTINRAKKTEASVSTSTVTFQGSKRRIRNTKKDLTLNKMYPKTESVKKSEVFQDIFPELHHDLNVKQGTDIKEANSHLSRTTEENETSEEKGVITNMARHDEIVESVQPDPVHRWSLRKRAAKVYNNDLDESDSEYRPAIGVDSYLENDSDIGDESEADEEQEQDSKKDNSEGNLCNVKNLYCKVCPYVSSNQASLDQHVMLKHHILLQCCHLCSYKAFQKGEVKNHIKQKHPSFACKQCVFKTFNEKYSEIHSIVFKHACHQESLSKKTNKNKNKKAQNTRQKQVKTKNLALKTLYSCKLCSFKTPYKYNLMAHNVTNHLGKLDINCQQCPFKTHSESYLKNHCIVFKHKFSPDQENSDVSLHHCWACRFTGKSNSDVTKHFNLVHRILTSTNKGPFSCRDCPFVTYDQRCLAKHNIVFKHLKLVVFKFSCSQCSFESANKASLKKHLVVHNSKYLEKIQKCDECDKTFALESNLHSHKLYHKRTLDISCNMCGYKTFNQQSLKQHMTKHSDERLFKCNLCSFKGKTIKDLRRHTMYVHDKKKRPVKAWVAPERFKCDLCDFKCSINSKLIKHVRLHTNERPYSCEHCDLSFRTHELLKKHRRTHTGERPYACTQCDFKARQQVTLINHMRTHTGERPFGCNQCSYRATQKQSLDRHLYNIHTTAEEKKTLAKGKKSRKRILTFETVKKDEDPQRNEALKKVKRVRAKPWRSHIISKPTRNELIDDDDADQIIIKKAKISKKVPVESATEGDHTDSKPGGDSNEVESTKEQYLPKWSLRKKDSKNFHDNGSDIEQEKDATANEFQSAKSGDRIQQRWSLRSQPEDKAMEKEPVVCINNINRLHNAQIRRRERIQKFALKKQKNSIQTKQKEAFIPIPTAEITKTDQVLLTEKESLEHLRKMTSDMWGNIFN